MDRSAWRAAASAAALVLFVLAAASPTAGRDRSRGPAHTPAPEPRPGTTRTATVDPQATAPFQVTTDIAVSSTIGFTTSGARTVHHLAIARPPFAGATITLTAEGAFGYDHATADVEQILDLRAGRMGSDCSPASDHAQIQAIDFATLSADGDVTVTVTNDSTVAPECAVNRHTVSLQYPVLTDRLDFPPTRTGEVSTIPLAVHQTSGASPFYVQVGVDGEGFSIPDQPLYLASDQVAGLIVSFTPAAARTYSAVVTLTPLLPGAVPVQVNLTGTGREPAIVTMDPASLDMTLHAGAETSRTVTVSNPGPDPLDLELSVEGRPFGSGSQLSCTSPTAFVLEGAGAALVQLDLADGTMQTHGPQIFAASSLAVSADASTMYAGTFQGDLYSLNLVTGKSSLYDDGPGGILDLAISPDGTVLYVIRTPGGVEVNDLVTLTGRPLAVTLDSPYSLDLGATGSVLYVATASGLIGIDPGSGAVVESFPELAHAVSPRVDEARRLVYSSSPDLRAVNVFDMAARTSTLVAAPAGTGYSHLSLSSDGRFAYGLDTTARTLTRIDLSNGAQQIVAAGLISPRDVEVHADSGCLGTFLTVDPTTLSVPPGGSVPVAARFSARGLTAGTYGATIRAREPGGSVILGTVPASLTVQSAPHLTVVGTPQSVQKETNEAHSSCCRPTQFTLPLAVPVAPQGEGTLEITAAAALYEGYGVSIDGSPLGGESVPQCLRTTRTLTLPSDLLARAAQDHVVNVSINMGETDDYAQWCGGDYFAAKLTYLAGADPIDFGVVSTADRKSVPLHLKNDGDRSLELQQVVPSGAGFSAAPESLEIPPGGEAKIDIGFASATIGRVDGLLTIQTNDPEAPSMALPLIAHVVAPSTALSAPLSLNGTAPKGGTVAATVSLRNDGGLPLDFDLSVTGSDIHCPPQFLLTPDFWIDLRTGDVFRNPAQEPYSGGSGRGGPHGMTVDPTGRMAFVSLGGWTGGIAGGDWERGSVAFLRGSGNARGIAYRPDRGTVVFNASGMIQEYDPRTNSIIQIGAGANGDGIAITRDGRTAYMTSVGGFMEPGSLKAFDFATGTIRIVSGGLAEPQGVALSGDEMTAYVVEANFDVAPFGYRLLKIDLGSGVATQMLDGLAGSEAIAVDPTRNIAYIGQEVDDTGTLALDLQTGEVTTLVEGHSAALALVPEAGCSGRFVALPFQAGTLQPGESRDIPVTLETQDLQPGTFTATLHLKSNDPARPVVDIPIHFEVQADADADGVADAADDCPAVANADQADADGDGRGDACDNCPDAANADQADRNQDGAGDACQPEVAFLAFRQAGDGFLLARVHLDDPRGEPLTGVVSIVPAGAAGAGPTLGLAPFQVPFTDRPPRRIALAGLLPGQDYRLEVSATNGRTPPFVAGSAFRYQGEGTLAFNEPPVAALAAPQGAVECDGPGGASVLLSGAASSDADSTPGTTDDIASYAWLLDPGQPDEQVVATGPSATVRLPLGSQTVGLRVTDRLGESSVAMSRVIVADTVAPALSVRATPDTLWPPNHRMIDVTLHWQATDVCDPHPAVTVTTVTSSEPDDAPGPDDGTTTGDIGAVATPAPGTAVVTLRAERAGNGPGRTYHVTLAATDASSNTGKATATIMVPHDARHVALTAGAPKRIGEPAPVTKH